MDEKQLQKLIRKNVQAVEKAKQQKPKKHYDPTLSHTTTDDDDLERKDFFDQMKKREF
ncbi:MAG TPA: hypothetical protein VGD77_15620 [Gemmatimonadaceae bacterium]|jgi:hypothetical protein